MRAIACLGLLLLSGMPACTAAQQSPTSHAPVEALPAPHNGLWWAKKSGTWREGFITGYKSGTLHEAGRARELNSYPASELLDGVNKFYDDFRNRNILIDNVLQYVMDQMRGSPDDKLKAELLKLRAQAAPTIAE